MSSELRAIFVKNAQAIKGELESRARKIAQLRLSDAFTDSNHSEHNRVLREIQMELTRLLGIFVRRLLLLFFLSTDPFFLRTLTAPPLRWLSVLSSRRPSVRWRPSV